MMTVYPFNAPWPLVAMRLIGLSIALTALVVYLAVFVFS